MSAPGLVLLHGQPDFGPGMWALRRALHGRLGEDVTILAPDRPGYGANPEPVRDFVGNVDWLHELIERRQLHPVVVVGHSWAGGIAITSASAANLGSPIVGTVLMASIGPGCLVGIDPWLARPITGELFAYLSLEVARPLLMRRARSLYGDLFTAAEDVFVQPSRVGMSTRPVWRSFLFEQRALLDGLGALNTALPSITGPALVLHGSADQLIPATTPRSLATRIPFARRAELPGAGHDLHLRRTAEVAGHIAAFARPLLRLP